MTLIELLVAVSILVVVAGVIGACIGAGIRVWDRSRSLNVLDIEGLVGLEIVERDLMNAIPFRAIPFRGRPTEVAFAGVVPPEVAGSGERIGTVKYAFLPQRRALLRRQWDYPGTEPLQNPGENVVRYVRDVRFAYAGQGQVGGAGWQETWDDPTNFPKRVRLSLTLEQGGGTITLQRHVMLPLGPQ